MNQTLFGHNNLKLESPDIAQSIMVTESHTNKIHGAQPSLLAEHQDLTHSTTLQTCGAEMCSVSQTEEAKSRSFILEVTEKLLGAGQLGTMPTLELEQGSAPPGVGTEQHPPWSRSQAERRVQGQTDAVPQRHCSKFRSPTELPWNGGSRSGG